MDSGLGASRRPGMKNDGFSFTHSVRVTPSFLRNRPPDFDPSGKSPTHLSSPFRKNISVFFLPKSLSEFPHPVPLEGRIMIVTDVGAGCGGRGRRFDECADLADGEAVWS